MATPRCDESGVEWDPAANQCKVEFVFNGQAIFVGLFEDVVQAVVERRKAQARSQALAKGDGRKPVDAGKTGG